MREIHDAHRMPYDEAKCEVEGKLRKQQLTKPLTEKEMAAFCEAMVRQLDLKPSDLPDVRGWANNWQSEWFRSSGG
jgi:hypothetical protein